MATTPQHPLRFLDEHRHLTGAFGADTFGRRAEAIAQASLERQQMAEQTTESLRTLIEQNTALTEETRKLAAQVDELTRQIHSCVVEQRA